MLRTMELELRRWRVEDAAALGAAVEESLAELRPWMPWAAGEPRSVADRRELIRTWEADRRAGGDEMLGIWVDGRVAGSCGLHRRIGPRGLEIGYWVSTRLHRRGVATEAARRLCARAFADPAIDHVEIHHATANVASGGVPAKLGFAHVRDLPRAPEAPGEDGTFRIWRLTREAWERRAAAT